jgi:hypothetical protein
MIIATLDTRHYSFVALGEDEAEAIGTLREGWKKHKKATDAGPWEDFSDGVVCVDLEPGQCARDGSLL